METKESLSPPAVVPSAGERALAPAPAELEAAVMPVEMELREKTLLLAFV